MSGPRPLRTPIASAWREQMFLEKAAILLWSLAILVTGGRALLQPHRSTVYPIFADAARHWLASDDMYEINDYPYRYSPAVAVSLIPFALLPDGLGGCLWRLLGAIVFLIAVHRWSDAALPWPLGRQEKAALFLLLLPFAVGNLNNGQSNLMVTGLLLLALSEAARHAWAGAGASVAAATFVKVYPLSMGLLLALISPKRYRILLPVFLAIGLLLPFAAQRTSYVLEEYTSWLAMMGVDDRENWPAETAYRDLRLLFRLCGAPLPHETYLALQLAGGALAAAFVLGVAKKDPESRWRFIAILGVCTAWITLLGPATESTTYVFLAPALAWACVLAASRDCPRFSAAAVFASYGLFLISQVVLWIPGGVGRRVHGWGVQPLAALLFAIGFVWWVRRACLEPTRESLSVESGRDSVAA